MSATYAALLGAGSVNDPPAYAVKLPVELCLLQRHHVSGIRQRIESIFWTLKDQLGLEARARTLQGLRARIASKLLAYSAGIWLNWILGRPSRSFTDLTA